MGFAVGLSVCNYESSVLRGLLSQVKLVVIVVDGFGGE